jgi:putative phosphoribosyl transferase
MPRRGYDGTVRDDAAYRLLGGRRTRRFADRVEAGQVLGERVAELGLADPVVLALPRGGVPVAGEVARALHAPLDVYVARKIGAPGRPELGVGAIAEDGRPMFDLALLDALCLRSADLASTVARERAELRRRVAAYRGDRELEQVEGRDAVVVDDGLATGGTARAALGALRRLAPRRLVLAVPVAPPDTLRALLRLADDTVAVVTPAHFGAVGAWYRRFEQLDDTEVLAVLEAVWKAGPTAPGSSEPVP